jgi:hypothetical protein
MSEAYTALIILPEVAVFFFYNFSLPLFAPIFIYIHISQFHLYHSVNIYSNWLQQHFF